MASAIVAANEIRPRFLCVPSFVQTYPRNRIKRIIVRIPVIGRTAVFMFRARVGLNPLAHHARAYLRWLFTSREWTNLTCDITDHNQRELAEFVHLLTGASRQTVRGYLDEGLSDSSLGEHVSKLTAAAPHYANADREARLSRRLGWYALVRIRKPRVVVESGIDKGLGTCVLAAAVLRNEAEGAPGKVYALDIEPGAGWLIQPPYDSVVEFREGDSHSTLRTIPERIDLFVHDSDHSYAHESGEYEIIRNHLSEHAIVLSDNAHKSAALMDFAESLDRRYHFWPERPRRPFHPAGGTGAFMFPGRDS